jgi:predicted XRE-type DNA-binding protein
MAQKKIVLSICLPRPLAEIREEIVCETVRLFGTQKEAAKNLNISQARVSHMLNRIRRRKPSDFSRRRN